MSNKTKKAIKIIGERDISLNLDNHQHQEQIIKIAKALSIPARLQILNLLKFKALSIQEIAGTLDLPVSSVALHIRFLEDAKMVITESQPGLRGSMRVCVSSVQSIHIDTAEEEFDPSKKAVTVDMPIGNYYHCYVEPTCGLADANGEMMDNYDSPKAFFTPRRGQAQLIWFQQGYVEYRFPNYAEPQLSIKELSFSLELCSEAPGYMENWPSDITISINDLELTTYRCPGDFGARHGNYTPAGWQNGKTQYGILKTFSVRQSGGFLDGDLVNPHISLTQLNIQDRPYISIKIEIKETAQYVGGINIFGEKFGDYPQGILMRIIY
ncbi:ArsR family transcriptional regulator [Clostridium sp. KNHs216]|uniref:ArsR/SmtB family transcription factor n=1 Tax=Clostridium sp. KNHs216 TaxID=1550235 RepID=UPI00056DD464|nr:ArsR family transcriptional regulator [Clostridium sp. KNHs216]TQI68221.1 putative transcriptional regulator [Clostridium sp. KNHs216]